MIQAMVGTEHQSFAIIGCLTSHQVKGFAQKVRIDQNISDAVLLTRPHSRADIVEFVPIWIDNINRVLPKGKWLPIPLLCDIHVGESLKLAENEEKQAFLERTRNALLALDPNAKKESEKC